MVNSDSKLTEYSIEDIVKYINEKKIDESSYLSIVEELNLTQQDKDKLLQKFKFAFERKNLSLTTGEKLLFFFIPYGILDDFIRKNLFHNNEDNFKKGYFRKQKQIAFFSTLGIIFYIVLFMFFHIINKAS